MGRRRRAKGFLRGGAVQLQPAGGHRSCGRSSDVDGRGWNRRFARRPWPRSALVMDSFPPPPFASPGGIGSLPQCSRSSTATHLCRSASGEYSRFYSRSAIPSGRDSNPAFNQPRLPGDWWQDRQPEAPQDRLEQRPRAPGQPGERHRHPSRPVVPPSPGFRVQAVGPPQSAAPAGQPRRPRPPHPPLPPTPRAHLGLPHACPLDQSAAYGYPRETLESVHFS